MDEDIMEATKVDWIENNYHRKNLNHRFITAPYKTIQIDKLSSWLFLHVKKSHYSIYKSTRENYHRTYVPPTCSLVNDEGCECPITI